MQRWDLASAQAANDLQSWIEEYLAVPEWANPGLLRRVREYATVWEGPKLVPLEDLLRIAGPGESYLFPQDEAEWHAAVKAIVRQGVAPESLPPLILWQTEGGLNVADGNHRLDALLACGYTEGWAIVSPYPLREGGREAWLAEKARISR